MNKKKSSVTGLIVLGMHRSGTSAVAGLLNALGSYMGGTLVETESDINAKGYWENYEANTINEELLHALDSSWADVFPLKENWLNSEQVKTFDLRIERLLAEEFSVRDIWAVKDPRFCRVLPLWLRSLERLKLHVGGIVVLRNPFEVAASLEKRNRFEPEFGMTLWLRYVLESDYVSRRIPRAFIRYDDLLSDWRSVMEHVQDVLGSPLKLTDSFCSKAADEFIDSKLKHHEFSSIKPASQISDLAWRVYSSLSESAPNQVEDYIEELNDLVIARQPWLAQTVSLQNVIDELRNENLLARGFSAKLKQMQNSRSWRWTSPLRRLFGKTEWIEDRIN